MTLTPEQQAAAAQAAAQEPGAVPTAPTSAPAPVAEPTPTPTPAQPAPPAAAPAKTPWDQDLAQRFPDEATRNAVSAYLGEKVQPYVTQVEQQAAEARELLDDFRSAPKETFLEVAQELIEAEALSPEDLTAYVATLTPAEQAQVAAAAEAETAPEAAQLPPEVQEIITERQEAKRAEQEKAAWDAEFARVKQANPTLTFDEDLFIPEVARLGDFDAAVASYQERYGDYLDWRKQNPATETDPLNPTPPEVLGSGEATGGSEQPTEKKYETLDEAVDDFFAERRAAGQTLAPKPPAPPVATA